MNKKVIFIPLIFLISIILLSYFYLRAYQSPYPTTSKEKFVTIKNHHFTINDTNFTPIIYDYRVYLSGDKQKIWPCRFYRNDTLQKIIKKNICLAQIKNELNKIKEEGYNTVKIKGLGTTQYFINNKRDSVLKLEYKNEYTRYLDALSLLFRTIDDAGLKAIFSIKLIPNFYASKSFLQQVTERFKNDPTIIAYEFRAPYWYLNNLNNKQLDVYYTVKSWDDILKRYAPFQLSIINISGIKDIPIWNPAIFNADIISYQPHTSNCKKIRKDLNWFSRNVEKTFILDLTKLDQRPYCLNELNYIKYFSFEGFISKQNQPIKGNNNIVKNKKLLKTSKQNIKPHQKSNVLYSMAGQLVDNQNKPIKDGIILGWNKDSTKHVTSISKENGNFKLTAHFEIYFWLAAAIGKSSKFSIVNSDSIKINKDTITSFKIGTIKLKNFKLLK